MLISLMFSSLVETTPTDCFQWKGPVAEVLQSEIDSKTVFLIAKTYNRETGRTVFIIKDSQGIGIIMSEDATPSKGCFLQGVFNLDYYPGSYSYFRQY